MKKSKSCIAILLAFAMILSSVSHLYADTARVITVHGIEGNSVSLSRGNARAATPRVGQRLANGNTITTGTGSSVYLQMDRDSILKMDEQSRVVVTSSRRRLSLTVQSGSALIDAGAQSAGETLETRVGNVGLTVRGTMFTVGRTDNSLLIVMLSGSGDVNGIPIPAGEGMVVRADTQAAGVHFEAMQELDLGQLPLFTLNSIAANAEYLRNVFPQEAFQALPALIETRTAERDQQRIEQATRLNVAANADAQQRAASGGRQRGVIEAAPTPAATPAPPPAPPSTGGGGGNGGGGNGGGSPTIPTIRITSTSPSALAVDALPGDLVTLAVTAEVDQNATMSFQWFLDGQPIDGETSSTLSFWLNLSPGNHSFFAEVTATGGAVPIRSSVITLRVLEYDGQETPPLPINGQFTCPVFLEAVLEAAGLAPGDLLFSEQAGQIETLTANGIESTNGLYFLTELRRLDVSNSYLTYINVGRLVYLEFLDIRHNNLPSISAVVALRPETELLFDPQNTTPIVNVPPGTGTDADPFLISEPSHLTWMANTLEETGVLAGAFLQTADIIAPDDTIIGCYVNAFTGDFDGNGHTITVNIYAPNENYVGLFATVSGPGNIRNLVVDGSVTGFTNVGGVVGMLHSDAQILVVTSMATVMGYSYVGGIVGTSDYSTIEESISTGAVHAYGSIAGGLVGAMIDSQLTNSYSTADVLAETREAGGLVGFSSASTIETSFATGEVSADEFAGGLIGMAVGSPFRLAVDRSVAFNSAVTSGGDNSGRVIGGWPGIGYMDYILTHLSSAYENILVNGLTVAPYPDDLRHGECLASPLQPSAWFDLGFDDVIWDLDNIPAGGLPTLRNIPASVIQNPVIDINTAP
ncbi:MAG: FecR domain-containing protein [Defluviitaleaceae bacterium]|nr:FecR domain-containing protein [Defluviitaleaceae bacterium]